MNSIPAETAPAELSAHIELRNGDSRVILCPEFGAAIARYVWRGRDILRPAGADVLRTGPARKMGCYPLVPYSNRIGGAELIADGRRYRLRANAPPEPHALHGFGWQRAWCVSAQQRDSLEMELLHRPDQDWPFACEASFGAQLRESGLHLRLALRNSGDVAMPAGLGLHPFFPLWPDTRLQAHWQHRWAMGPDKLPTGAQELPPEADFRVPRTVLGWQVDHCFSGWDQRARLLYPGYEVLLEATGCGHLVCYAPGRGKNFIALEPVSHVNNAFALAERGISDTGARVLAPGEVMDISLTIAPSEAGGIF